MSPEIRAKRESAWEFMMVLRKISRKRKADEGGLDFGVIMTVGWIWFWIEGWGFAKRVRSNRAGKFIIREKPLVVTLWQQRCTKGRGRINRSMADEMTKQMENLKFSEEELADVGEEKLGLSKHMEGSEKWMVGKLVSPKMVDTGLLIRVFFAVWKDTPLEEAMTLGPNLFLFKFKQVEFKESVLNRCPLSFNGELLALKVFDGILSPHKYNFGPLPMWVRVYKVQLGMMTQQMGEIIGDRMGSHIAVDMREGEGRMGEFLRVRTEIDNLSHLRRCVTLGRLPDGNPRICMVKYERLPKFCYYCGVIGHGWELCTTKPEGFEGPFQFGECLRVDMGKPSTQRKR
ncbi:hypothetical protein GQ457_17G003790 [Hibiscus cannabinus]